MSRSCNLFPECDLPWLTLVEPPRASLGDVLGEGVLAGFASTTLAELGAAVLADRTDVKFMVPRAELSALLAPWSDSYRVLEIEGRRAGRYRTCYYDTPDLALYRAHLLGRIPRHKIRLREYRDSGHRFLELKTRNAHGRTVKTRVPVPEETSPLDLLHELPLPESLRGVALAPTLEVGYTRITLVHRNRPERITIDVDLVLGRGSSSVQHPHVAIVEVKRAGRGRSEFLDATRHWSRHTGTLSKYGLGVAALVPGIRRHRHLPALRRLRSLDAHAA